MAKKAKRRGRPPGTRSPDKMDVSQLRQYIDKMETLLKRKVSDQRSYLEAKLSELTDFASAKGASLIRAVAGAPKKRAGTRKKAAAKYRSRKDPKIVWSGRGMTPIWMRDEMKGTRLKKDDFLIAKG